MKLTIIFVLFCSLLMSNLYAEDTQKLDSMLQLYEKLPDDTMKVKVLHHICQIMLYTDPSQAYTYAREMIAISEKVDFQNGIAMGCYRAGGYFLNRHELDSAYHYHKRALEISKQLNNIASILNGNTELGVIHIRKNNFDSAAIYLNRNIALYNKRDSLPPKQHRGFKHLGATYQNLSIINFEKGRFNLALEDALKALRFYEDLGDELFVADGLNSLGVIEGQLKNHEKSIAYFKEAHQVYLKHNDKVYECITLNNIGLALVQLGDPEQAIDYYLQAIKIARDNKFMMREGSHLNNLATAYLELKRYDEAEEALLRSVDILVDSQYPKGIQGTYLTMGSLYNAKRQPQKAINYLDKSIAISDSLDMKSGASRAYYVRSESYQQLNRYHQALDDFILYSQLNDSVFNTTKSQQIEELRIVHETEKNEQEIALQRKEISLLEEQARVNTLQRALLAGGLIFTLIVFGLGVYGLKQKIKRNRLEKEKLDAELEFKKKELTTHALNLARKNEVLERLKMKAQELKREEQGSMGYNELIRTINFDLQDDNNWKNFTSYFEQVHKDFHNNVKKKFPDLTPNELRLMALLKMNLSSKEIANILNVTADGIKKARYRLRKKLSIQTEDSLEEIALSM